MISSISSSLMFAISVAIILGEKNRIAVPVLPFLITHRRYPLETCSRNASQPVAVPLALSM